MVPINGATERTLGEADFGHLTPGWLGVGELGWINTSRLPQKNFPES